MKKLKMYFVKFPSSLEARLVMAKSRKDAAQWICEWADLELLPTGTEIWRPRRHA